MALTNWFSRLSREARILFGIVWLIGIALATYYVVWLLNTGAGEDVPDQLRLIAGLLVMWFLIVFLSVFVAAGLASVLDIVKVEIARPRKEEAKKAFDGDPARKEAVKEKISKSWLWLLVVFPVWALFAWLLLWVIFPAPAGMVYKQESARNLLWIVMGVAIVVTYAVIRPVAVALYDRYG